LNPEKPSGKNSQGVKEGVKPHLPKNPREKTPRGYRKGTDSPLARTTLFQEASPPEKACTEKEKSKQDVHSGYAEGEALGVGRGLCPILAYPLVGTVGDSPEGTWGDSPALVRLWCPG